jgi:tetratricopeptide (TPR) repeat protein
MVRALADAASGKGVETHARRKWAALVAPVTAAAVAFVIWVSWPNPPPLDLNRIVAFPFEVSGIRGEADLRLGRDVAYLIVSALDNQGGVKWLEGWDRLELQLREGIRSATEHDLSEAARASRAGFFLDGQIMLGDDSSRVILALHSTEDDSRVERADTAGIRSETEHIAYRAVGKVLLSLLPDVGRVGMNAVAGRSHRAIQPFVRAEREFYYGRYREAFEHYEEAVEADSTFALAAVKAAQAASWNHRQRDAVDLIRIAIEHVETLPQRWAHFARGFEAFLNVDGDAAVFHFEQAVQEDEEWADGWMGLGEAYTHLLPRKTPQDSLGYDAFLKAYERSQTFAPAIYHLTEHAIQEGDISRASELLAAYRAAGPDLETVGILELALQCAEGSPASIDWPAAVRNNANQVYLSALLLNVRASNPECAETAWRAVLSHDTTGATSREYASLLGLQGLLSVTGQYDELRRVVDSAAAAGTVFGTAVSHMVILDALAGGDVEYEAEQVVNDLRDNPPTSVPADVRFWYLGIWDAHRGNHAGAQIMSDSVAQYALERGGCQAQFLTRSLEAHVLVASGDTLSAVDALASLQSECRRPSTYPWFGRGLEMITLARIHFALGRFEDAIRVARGIDAPASVPNGVFLPASLLLRMRAAEELGEGDLAERCRERLNDLGRHDLVVTTEPGMVH